MEVRRKGNRVFFDFTEDDKKVNDFFDVIIFTDRKNYLFRKTYPLITILIIFK